MRERFTPAPGTLVPPFEAVFGLLEMPPSGRHESSATAARTALLELARPSCVIEDLGGDDLAAVLAAGGCPEDSPVGAAAPSAARRALYAVTLGAAVEQRVRALFAEGEEVAGLFLDATASCAADRASRAAVERTLGRWGVEGGLPAGTAALGFSPGYCGWPVEGQRALFEALRPGEAGITLGPSCLMEPLKSISGAILAGPPALFSTTMDHPFCEGCQHPDCGERKRSMPVWNG